MAEQNYSPSQPDQVSNRRPALSINRLRAYLQKNTKKVLVALLVFALLFFVYNYIHTRDQLNRLSNPQTASKDAAQQIIDRVSKFVELPTGETPTLATVNDASKLKNQTFFRSAQNGDKVLIYSKAGKALLYRPSTNKIISFSPINIGANQQ